MSSSPSHDAREPDLGRLERIMAQLRSPQGGCPWDLEQTLTSLRPYLLEEAYEVLDVMDGHDPDLHREELGDLLFQVVFQSQLRREAGDFELADVVEGSAPAPLHGEQWRSVRFTYVMTRTTFKCIILRICSHKN